MRNPNVTAGLKWAPEMWPTAETMTPIARPCASATPTSVRLPGTPTTDAIAPQPTKTSVKVPTNSANARLSGWYSTGREATRGLGRRTRPLAPLVQRPVEHVAQADDPD